MPNSKLEDKYNLLTVRKERLWQRLQTCYDLIKFLPTELNSFKLRVEQLHKTREEFTDLLDELGVIQKLDSTFATDVLKLSESFDNLYFQILTVALEYPDPPLATALNTTMSERPSANLPVIPLTKFDGTYESFPAFKALYDDLIHNTDLPNIKKFTYLLGYVENSALQLVKTVNFTPENYIIAYNLLVKRFTNKRLIANYHLSAIFNIKPLKVESPKAVSQFVDSLEANISALRSLQISNFDNYLLTEFSLRYLDSKTRQAFEKQHLGVDFPTVDNLLQFLRDQCSVYDLSTINTTSSSSSSSNKTFEKLVDRKRIAMNVQNLEKKGNLRCPLCNDSHKLKECHNFLASNSHTRYDIIKKLKRCVACLGNHNIKDCNSKFSCTSCGSRTHNSLLHFERSTSAVTSPPSNDNNQNTENLARPQERVSFSNSYSVGLFPNALLGTAQAQILTKNGSWINCRILLDPGSQVNFITTALVERLKIPRKKCPYELMGVGQTSLGPIQGLATCSIAAVGATNPLLSFDAVIIPRITSDLPLTPLSSKLKDQFSSIQLADPDFYNTAPIDLLLGVETVLDLTPSSPAQIKGNPSAVLTSLGWVIMGSIPSKASRFVNSMCAHIDSSRSLDETIRSFWESEEITLPVQASPEDEICEQFFQRTTTRDDTGRYITRLPFREGIPPSLECNREVALKRFFRLEIRFKREPLFYQKYSENIADYIAQGHLTLARKPAQYILTHHGVPKYTPEGTQVRVVFNPAERDAKGISLNDTLLCGPRLQSDIAEIINRFRIPQIALTCDIRQMFRAIWLHPQDRIYQHIFWRSSPDQPLEEWEHTRVIFGAKSSPFLAQRVIQKLIEDEGSQYPIAAAVLRSSRYVDDVLSGADSESEVIVLRDQLIHLLGKGGFELGKWSCSSKERILPEQSDSRELTADTNVKVLGLLWTPKCDYFSYKIHIDDKIIPTKRGVLSRIARIYDINGYISPFIFSLKTLMQQLWLLKIDWDDALPNLVSKQWSRINEELPQLENIKIPRCIVPPKYSTVRLLGFSDASSLGMAAVVYLRVEENATFNMKLLASKTRVAPLKTWTIPRLELGAACLLSKLMMVVTRSLSPLKLDTPICFTDSSTTISWIQTPPFLLKTFVANRVSQINENLPDVSWRHVPGKHNPADPASRGLLPSELVEHSLWWNGPEFAYRTENEWPDPKPHLPDSVPELKRPEMHSFLSMVNCDSFILVFERSSSLSKLQRVVGYMNRFIHNCRARVNNSKAFNTLVGQLSAAEYQQALEFIIKITQLHHLKDELIRLNKGALCSKRYQSLTPFLSSQGYVMVGGRMRHANIPERSRHPYLIPKSSHLANLLVDHYHKYSGHGGPRLVQSLIHRQFWIPSIRSLIRKRLFRCLICYRFKAAPTQPVMADIPAFRLRPSRCFTHTGVDFAGPFFVKASLLRTNRSVKCYMALFICMVTKAVHLEAVSDLSTKACLAAIDRFVSRRGLPAHIYSDQGRNFRGCAREISDISKLLDTSHADLAHYLALRNVEWHFNPPYSPNFGGLWEAGVKSSKHHLKRIIGKQILTFEEFNTILTRVEGILNSRPLCAVSNSPDDNPDCLTPGHFLIGAPILARPEPCILNISENRLTRWQLTQHMVQSFWKRWSKEYLNSQICRPKWVAPSRVVTVGDIVFWCDPSMPPLHWPMGRVSHVLPGKDGVVRVLKIETGKGEITRPTNKVVLLPKD